MEEKKLIKIDLSKKLDENERLELKNFYINNPYHVLQTKYRLYLHMLNDDDFYDIFEAGFKIDMDLNELDDFSYILYFKCNSQEYRDKMITYLIKECETRGIKPNVFNIYNRDQVNKDPLKAIYNDISNIKYIGFVDDDTFYKILDYLNNHNHVFTNEDGLLFIEGNMSGAGKEKRYKYFIKNCICSDKVLSTYFRDRLFTNLEIYKLYYKYKNIRSNFDIDNMFHAFFRLNVNNFNTRLIIKEMDIYYFCDKYGRNYNKILKILEELKDVKTNIIIQMERVNMDFINKAYAIIGDKLRIIPVENQYVELISYHSRPRYTYESIKESEDKLNLYARCMDDKVDKDGEVKRLSPFEKYICSYMMANRFGEYKLEGRKGPWNLSRALYDITQGDKPRFIVCPGYSCLFTEFLYRAGIKEAYTWDIRSDGKIDAPCDHTRVMSRLIDRKYHINGIYMADPTWDSHDIKVKNFQHMVMDEKSALEIDKNLGITLESMNVDDEEYLNDTFKVKNAKKMFNRPISKLTIAKAFVNIHRFFDPNAKMINDDSEYNYFELCDVLNELGYNIYEYIDDNKFFKYGMKVNLSELKNYHMYTISAFLTRFNIKYLLDSKNPYFMSIEYDDELKKYNLIANVYDDDIILDRLEKNWDIYYDYKFRILSLEDESLENQLDKILSVCDEFKKDYRKICSELEEEVVK